MNRALALLVVAACAKSSDPAKVDVPRVWLGVEVGVTTLPDARAGLEHRGFTCEDASLMEMMRAAHAKHGVPANIDAQGESSGVGTPGASPLGRGRSPRGIDGGLPPGEMPAGHAQYLKDPALAQGRVTCSGLTLDEPGLVPVGLVPRVLLVADRPDAPVSLLAIQRTYPRPDALAAAADALAMFDGLGARYGTPTETHGDLPAAGTPLPALSPVRRVWKLAGVTLEARATDVGGTGISVSEEVRAP